MKKVNKTTERLNKALAKAGFPGANVDRMFKLNGGWQLRLDLRLNFDEGGNYERPCKEKRKNEG